VKTSLDDFYPDPVVWLIVKGNRPVERTSLFSDQIDVCQEIVAGDRRLPAIQHGMYVPQRSLKNDADRVRGILVINWHGQPGQQGK
jgi:hypothetical protein